MLLLQGKDITSKVARVSLIFDKAVNKQRYFIEFYNGDMQYYDLDKVQMIPTKLGVIL